MANKGSSSIAGLVFLIAVFIIIYVLVMPPCDKCRLLNNGNCVEICDGNGAQGIILDDQVGGVNLKDEINHNLDSVNLYIRVEPEDEKLAGSLFVSRGWFGNVDQDLSFELEDLDNLEEVYFTTKIINGKGKLFIELNGRLVDQIDDNKGNIVVPLPSSYLKEKNNLKLYTSSPGIAFWSKNQYDLEDLKIRKEFERVHYEESRTFSVSKSEKEALTDSTLKFSVFCSAAGSLSVLKVYLNDGLLSSESITCKSFDKEIDIQESNLRVGENKITFVIDDGNYLLTPILVNNKLSDGIYPSYNFNVDEDIYNSPSSYFLSLQMGLGNKKAKILINDYNIELNSANSYFQTEITRFIKVGNNFLEIIPENDFEVSNVKVWYE